jgi:polyhydroxyalkanoate synthesis regulator phasin
MAELTPAEIKRSIAYFEGVADNLEKRVLVLQDRIEKGRELGAEDPSSKYHEHFKKLVDEWLRDGEQAEEFRISANNLLFKLPKEEQNV